MPEIIGIYKNQIIWKCDKGFYHELMPYHSGCLICNHTPYSTTFDFLDVSTLIEVTDQFIGCSIVYEHTRDGKKSEYSSGFDYKYLAQQFEESQNRKEKNLTYKNIGFTLKVRFDEEYHRFLI